MSYHVNDPTGTSLVLVDGNGDGDGRTLYDSFGMVMENTLSAELAGALLDVPDAATGLVHLGDGRWYDPALGRPLQPNPAGGPPTVPQALNRYTATPLGQPGVAVTSSNGNISLLAASLTVGSLKTLGLEIANEYKLGFFGKAVIASTRYSGQAFIGVQSARPKLESSRGAIESLGGVYERSAATKRLLANGTENSKLSYTTDYYRFETSIDEIDNLITKIESIDTLNVKGPWRGASHLDSLGIESVPGRVTRFSSREWLYIGFVTDFGLGFGFQYLDDLQNPYFTPGQRIGRAGLSGLGGGALSTLGGVLGGALGCGPAAPICITVGALGGGLFWGYVQPMVFDAIPALAPTRNLAPIN